MANNLCWFEITSVQPEKARHFYHALFDWEVNPFMENYYEMKNEGVSHGGLMKKPPQAPATDVYIYFKVDSIEETLKQAESLGGKQMLPKTEIPGVGYYAFFADLDGNPIALHSDK